MERSNYAVFVDLENVGGKAHTLQGILEKVKIRGNILLGRVYGYSEQYSGLKELLLSNTFSVVPSLRYGKSQKNSSDITLVIDALETAFSNELIDCFCIVSGDSDYVPLVGKLKALGKTVMGISRSEVASNVFINACNEFLFLESFKPTPVAQTATSESTLNSQQELMALVEDILAEKAGSDGSLFISELKQALVRLRPDFNERNFGANAFSRLMSMLASKYQTIRVVGDANSLRVVLAGENKPDVKKLDKKNWEDAFTALFKGLKSEGFDRVNPSVIKAEILNQYPDFDERQIGFKRFSDIMRYLEKRGLVKVEMDDMGTMLIAIE